MRHLLALALLLFPACTTPSQEEVLVKLPAAGLFTNPNPLEKAPEGALARAENVVLDRDSVATPRAGQKPGPAFALADAPVRHLFEADGALYAVHDSRARLSRYTGSAWTGLTGDVEPSWLPGSAEAGGVVVFPGADLMQALEAGGVRASGVPRALDVVTWPSYSASWYAYGGSAWLPLLASAGYRVSLARKDATGRVLRGAPSGRYLVTNLAASPISPVLHVPLPEDATVEHFVEVWRTGAALAGADPGDSMQKVAELPLDATALAAGIVIHTDGAPDAFRGEAAYFNASQDGLAAMRLQPPLAAVVGAFRDQALYSDALELQTLRLRLLANLTHGDVVTVGTQSYVGNDSEVPATDDFHVETDGGYSLSQQIEITARSLVDAINLRRDGYTARYDSAPGDPPGIIVLETVIRTLAPITVSISAGPERFLPPLPAVTSALYRPGRTYASLKDQPGAVPLFAYVEPGDATKRTLAFASTRDSLFVFKEDGLFRLLPLSSGGFTWEPFNETLRLLAPRSVAVLENRIYALTNKGLVTVSDAGVEEVSFPIAPTLDALLAQSDAATLYTRAFGVAHEKQKRYFLWLPTAAGATEAARALVFNLATETWTERTDAAKCGVATEAHGLVLGRNDGSVSFERRTGALADFQDADGAPIPCRVRWVPDALGQGGSQKQFRDVAAVFEHDVPEGTTHGFAFGADGNADLTASVPAEGGPYVRAEVPADAQRCTRLGLEVSRDVLAEDFRLLGLEVRVRAFAGKLAR